MAITAIASQNFHCYNSISCSGHAKAYKKTWFVKMRGGVAHGPLITHGLKTRLLDLILGVPVSERESILGSLKSEVVYFSSYQKCILATNENTKEVPELSTKQEEADTKVILHAQ